MYPRSPQGNYDQHLANGGCPSRHHNGAWFCADRVGHYDYFTSRHYVKLAGPVRTSRGTIIETQTVEWN